MKDVVKVIPGEECVSQHKLIVIYLSIKKSIKVKAKGTRDRLKKRKLRSATGREEFECEEGKIVVQGKSTQERWNSLEHSFKKAAEWKGEKKHEETWW